MAITTVSWKNPAGGEVRQRRGESRAAKAVWVSAGAGLAMSDFMGSPASIYTSTFALWAASSGRAVFSDGEAVDIFGILGFFLRHGTIPPYATRSCRFCFGFLRRSSLESSFPATADWTRAYISVFLHSVPGIGLSHTRARAPSSSGMIRHRGQSMARWSVSIGPWRPAFSRTWAGIMLEFPRVFSHHVLISAGDEAKYDTIGSRKAERPDGTYHACTKTTSLPHPEPLLGNPPSRLPTLRTKDKSERERKEREKRQ